MDPWAWTADERPDGAPRSTPAHCRVTAVLVCLDAEKLAARHPGRTCPGPSANPTRLIAVDVASSDATTKALLQRARDQGLLAGVYDAALAAPGFGAAVAAALAADAAAGSRERLGLVVVAA